MQETFLQVSEQLRSYVPNLLAALVILVVGWLIALAVSAGIRRLLHRTNLDERIAGALSDTGSKRTLNTEGWLANAAFALIMLLTLIGFFQALNLAMVTTPLNSLLNQFLSFLPSLIGALVLLAIAWVTATVLRMVVARGLRSLRLDERVGDQMAVRPADDQEHLQRMLQNSSEAPARPSVAQVPLSETLATSVYWLVFLLFLPAVLDTLGLEGLLQPIQTLLNEVLAFLPKLLAAVVIVAVGWFIARIVQRVVTNLSAAVGIDRLAERVNLSGVLGSQRLSGLLGMVVYVLVLVPVIIAALNALQIEAITGPASSMLASFLNAIPDLFAAALILTFAYVLGRLAAGLVTNLLRGMGLDRLAARVGLTTPSPATTATTAAQTTARMSLSDIAGYLVLGGIMLFAAIAALNLLGFTVLAALVAQFAMLVGQILLGLVIFAIGLYLANLAASAILNSDVAQSGLLAMAARVAIIVLSGAMALRQMGLANEIINLAFGLLLGALAVAFALAFGLGGREPAGREVERLFQSLRARRADSAAAEAQAKQPPPSPGD